ncbi:MAG: hypothetical protein AB8G05_24340 [Oligoflexales bacterium]
MHTISKRICFTLCIMTCSFIYLDGTKCFANAKLDPSLALEGGFLGTTKIQTTIGALSLEKIYKKMALGDEIFVPSSPEEHSWDPSLVPKKISSISFYKPKKITKLKISNSTKELLSSSDQDFFARNSPNHEGSWTAASSLQVGSFLSFKDGDNFVPEVEVQEVETQANLNELRFYTIAVEDFATYFLAEYDIIAHNFNPLSWFPMEAAIHGKMVNASFLAGIATFISLMNIKAPYGRHIKEGWGPTIPSKWGWILMEIPSVLVFAGTYALGKNSFEAAPLLLAGTWLSHYCYRTFVYPNLIRSQGKKMPLSIAMSGFSFNAFNSYLNARWISHLGSYPITWQTDPRFILGSMVFASGLILNIHSDQILINLRKPGETAYKIPEGGGFEHVSAPNYLGELIEWTGWAIASWSLPGLSFALYTGANLIPRALANHKWYHEKFPEYPENRKAIIPKVL